MSLCAIRKSSYAEIQPHAELLAEYEAECANPMLTPMDPQWEMYAAMERCGLMTVFAVDVAGELVGFAAVLKTVNPHSGKKIATVESLFVAKLFRFTGAGDFLMQVMERHTALADCVAILYSVKAGSAFEKVMERKAGYERTNSVFCKTLSA